MPLISSAVLLEMTSLPIVTFQQRIHKGIAIKIRAGIELNLSAIKASHEALVGKFIFKAVVSFGRHDDECIAPIARHRHRLF